MAHHSDQHVDENNNDNDVVDGKQHKSYTLYNVSATLCCPAARPLARTVDCNIYGIS